MILFVLLAVVAAIWSSALTRIIDTDLRNSLAGMKKMGADIVVIRRGSSEAYTEPGNTELSNTAKRIRNIEDVVGVSTQLRLFTYQNSPWSEQPKAYVYAVDPATDLTVSEWLPEGALGFLDDNEVYVGNRIKLLGTQAVVSLAGMELQVAARLEETGTTLDDTIFVTFPAARVLAEKFRTLTEVSPGLEANYVPVFMVAVRNGVDVFEVSTLILKQIPGVTSFESSEFYRSGREQLTGLISSLDKIIVFVWLGALVGIATVFLISLNERRREIGVLRVLGADQAFALRTLIIEGLMLALIGAIPGVLVGVFGGASVLPRLLTGTAPQLIGLTEWLSSGATGLLVSFLSVIIATIVPILWVFRRDAAVSMRG